MNKEEMSKQIEEVLDLIRPYLQADGGDVEFIEVTDEGIVKVRLLGACIGCGFADVTMSQAIEESLLEEVPGIKAVELVQDNWIF